MPPKSNFLDKVLGRISRLDTEGLQTIVQRLARERNFLEMLFNTIEDGVLVIDENGRIIYFNQAVAQLLNWQAESPEGQPVTRFLPEFDWKNIASLEGRQGEKVVRHEFEIAFPRPRFIRLYAAPLDGEAGGRSGVALILHDATEARQKTFEAIESERLHSLTLLAASVAHEIGNPLNALHIHLQLMGREIGKLRASSRELPVNRMTRPGRAREQISEAKDELDQISRRLENYLEVAKGEISRLDYIVTQFLQAIRPSKPQIKMGNLNDVARETLDLLGPELENRSLMVETKFSRRLAPSPFDAAQIKQVLVNLIKNAMQAMTRGGKLTLETGNGTDGVWIRVGDTGGGIPQEQLNRIFEPFYTTKKKGSGLGLMIVQRIVREHGGRIELESRVGEGTQFRIWLPLHERPTRLLESSSPAS